MAKTQTPVQLEDLVYGKESKSKEIKTSKKPQFLENDENASTNSFPLDYDKKAEVDDIGTTNVALTRNANSKIINYITKSPQYKTIGQQLALLKEEYAIYVKSGNTDLIEKTKKLMLDLGAKKTEFIKLFKQKDYKKERTEVEVRIKNSDYLKKLKKQREELEALYKSKNPLSLLSKMSQFRELLESHNLIKSSLEEDYDNEEIVDIESLLDSNLESENVDDKTLLQEYNNFCGHIADILDITVPEVKEMSLGKLKEELKENCEDTTELKTQIDQIKIQASNELKKLKGKNDITDVMFEIFDFSTEEKQPKELLAAANIKYVSAIAYNRCSSLNMLHYFDDCVAYGLLGLTVAINKWYNIQKLENSAVSFEGFAHTYITNSIQKGLYELSSGGRINKDSMANIVFRRKKQFDYFLKNNPEFKDIPKDLLENMVEGLLEDLPGKTMTESEYTDMVSGGQQNDSGDVWANAVVSDVKEDTFLESKGEYERLIKGIKDLFGLFKTEVNKETGIKEITNKKIFNKYDYKLFLMSTGLEFKRTANNGREDYTQKEMGIILSQYYANDGETKTFDASAISTRLKVLGEKINVIMMDNPSIKAGFEYLLMYCKANQENINILSNSREELGIKLERDELREAFADNDKELNRMLSDGKKLSDIYQTSDTNPLDEEIAEYFRTY